MSDDGPRNARFAPNGSPFSALLGIDYSSMYLNQQEKDLPLTAGIRWTKKGQYYKKAYLSRGNSFKALQWLYWCEAELHKQGHQVIMEHQYHQGEREIEGYRVDGYVKIGDREIIYELNGEMTVDMIKISYSLLRMLDTWM